MARIEQDKIYVSHSKNIFVTGHDLKDGKGGMCGSHCFCVSHLRHVYEVAMRRCAFWTWDQTASPSSSDIQCCRDAGIVWSVDL